MEGELQKISIENIPEEIHNHIFEFLDVPALYTSALVCKKWKNFTTKDNIWKSFIEHQQAGAAHLCAYLIQKSTFQTWKSAFLFFSHHKWFISADFPCNTVIEYGLDHWKSLILSDKEVEPTEIMYIYSIIFTNVTKEDAAKAMIMRTYENVLADLASELVAINMSLVDAEPFAEQFGHSCQIIKKFHDIASNAFQYITRYPSAQYSWDDFNALPKTTFKNVIFEPLREQLFIFCLYLNEVKSKSMHTLQEVYSYIGESFDFQIPEEENPNKKTKLAKARIPTRYIAGDGTIVEDPTGALAAYSSVIQKMFGIKL